MARGNTALEISREEQGELGIFLQAVEQLGGFVRPAAHQDWAIHMDGHGERADVILLEGLAQLEVFGAVDIEKAGATPDHEELADFFLDGQLAQSLFGPLCAGAVVADWTRLLMLLFPRHGQT